jgi:hypothetical protein
VLGTTVALVAYVAVLLFGVAVGQREVFPFFRWDLFARVPAAVSTDYSVRLVAVDGEPLPRPVWFEDAHRYLSRAGSVDAKRLMWTLGEAVEDERTESAASARRLLETTYLADAPSVDYELVHRRFDPVERMDCRCFEEERVIGRYRAGRVDG